MAVLYGAAALVNLAAVWAVARSQVLMGEEMSVSIRDVLFSVEQRAQATVWSTNTVAPVYYWIGSNLDPSYSLFSPRRWKAIFMAALPPLVYAVLRRRLDCSRSAALVGGASAILLPGIAMFGWLATDNGFEAVIGVVGLLIATTRRSWWPVAPVVGGIAVAAYPSGLAWACAIGAVCAWRVIRSTAPLRAALSVVAAMVCAGGTLLVPLVWWTSGPERILAGGGTIEGTPIGNLTNLLHQLAVNGSSYYFFSEAPGLGSTPLALAIGGAAVVTALGRWRGSWPWLLPALVTVLLWVPMGNMPGLRRAIAIGVVAAIAIGVAVDLLVAKVAEVSRPGARAVTTALAVLILVPLAVSEAGWQVGHLRGDRALVAEFPIAPGPMPPIFDAWTERLRAGAMTAEEMVRDHDGLRTLAVVWMIADRRHGNTVGLPGPQRIVDLTVPH